MTTPVRPNEFAEAEIAHELRWYESESVGLGDRLWRDIQEHIELISTYPHIGEIIHRLKVRPSAQTSKAELLAQPDFVAP